jgi:hypothetical protein
MLKYKYKYYINSILGDDFCHVAARFKTLARILKTSKAGQKDQPLRFCKNEIMTADEPGLVDINFLLVN